MVDDEPRLRMAVNQRRARVEVPRAQEIDREILARRRAADAVEPGIVRRAVGLLRHDDPDTDRAWGLLPVRDDLGYGRIIRGDRLDEREPVRVGLVHVPRQASALAER